MKYVIAILAKEKEALDKHLSYCQLVIEDERFRESTHTRIDIMKTQSKLVEIEEAIKKLNNG